MKESQISDAVFVSDVHLSAEHPATTDAFLRFVDEQVAGRTARLYILGDLFEYWAGDDDLDDAFGGPLTRPRGPAVGCVLE